jgi:hypothetical protein
MKCPLTQKECEHPEKQTIKYGRWCSTCEKNKENIATLLITSSIRNLTQFEGFQKTKTFVYRDMDTMR